ncbi:Oligopeptide transporter 5 [Candida viswanathii]|uniref:Oligopeptide transporter 5 n=1 Tax=Candida viswanathii TaxID=5486 RepID=A0A367Y0S7_9ASCO|nr:Oligopeptide transporter 5 [Candida viswanathii]
MSDDQKAIVQDKTAPIEVVLHDVESSSDEALEPDVAELPKIVREVVLLEDDPTIPVVTFRFFLLATILIVPGAFISTMNLFRLTSAAYSIFFVQIVSHWCGKWLARVLPNKKIKLGRWINFNLNPGPWSIKETVLITIAASSGATGNMGTTPLALAELYYGQVVNPAVALFFMWLIVWVGYAYAAIARNFLLYDPQFVWPEALMHTTLFQTQDRNDKDSKQGSKQMRVFFLVLVGVCVWLFFPEFIFPMTSSLAFLCWVAPENYVANFIGSGLGGMGLLNLSLDWSNITSSIMLSPYWTQVIQFVAFVIAAWILIPAAKWGNLGGFKYGLMSNGLFLANGTKYPTSQLLTPDYQLNETSFAKYSVPNLGVMRLWNTFFDLASYTSGIVWGVVFGYKALSASFKKFIKARKEKSSVSTQYTDRLNKLQAAYKDVPFYWYGILFLASFVTLLTIFATDSLFMPWWCLIVALAFGAVIVVPLAWLYALSNFQLAIGTFNELLYGYIIQSQPKRHPAGASVYGSVSGDAWYRCQYILLMAKVSMYMHIDQRYNMFAMMYGELIGVPINYAALRWVLLSKRDYLSGKKTDPLHQWTGQSIASYQTNAIQYVVLGPNRLFKNYPVLPYGFLVGFGAPLLIYGLYRLFPRSKLQFNLWNTTVFFSSMSTFYGNVSTGYFSKFIGGTVTMFWAYRYKHELWKKYNYLIAAATDTGLDLAILLMFLFFSAGKTVTFPEWWGNNGKNIERCFAMSS